MQFSLTHSFSINMTLRCFIGPLLLVVGIFAADRSSHNPNPSLPLFKNADGRLFLQVPTKTAGGNYPHVIFIDPRQARPVLYSHPSDSPQSHIVYVQRQEGESPPEDLPERYHLSGQKLQADDLHFLEQPTSKKPALSPIEQFLKEVTPTTKTAHETLRFRPSNPEPPQVEEPEQEPEKQPQRAPLSSLVYPEPPTSNYPQLSQLAHPQQYPQSPQYQLQLQNHPSLQSQQTSKIPQPQLPPPIQPLFYQQPKLYPVPQQAEPQQIRYNLELQPGTVSQPQYDQNKGQVVQFLPRDSHLHNSAHRYQISHDVFGATYQRPQQPPRQLTAESSTESAVPKSTIYVSQRTSLKKPDSLSPTEEPNTDNREHTPSRRSKPTNIQYQQIPFEIEKAPRTQEALQYQPQRQFQFASQLYQPIAKKVVPQPPQALHHYYIASEDQSRPLQSQETQGETGTQETFPQPPHVIAISSVPPHFVRIQPVPHFPLQSHIQPETAQSQRLAIDKEELKSLSGQLQSQPVPPLKQQGRNPMLVRQQQKFKTRKPKPASEEGDLPNDQDYRFSLKSQAATYPSFRDSIQESSRYIKQKDRAVQIIYNDDE